MSSYGIGDTRLIAAKRFAPVGRLLVKLESESAAGSIKDRTAYYIFRDLLRSPRLKSDTLLVESTSGNFGVSLRLFAREFGLDVLCLVDSTMGAAKLDRLVAAGASIEIINSPDGNHRVARMRRAMELDGRPGVLWCNQYGNPANVAAHEETTGREIWEQTDGTIAVVVCAVGTGGTVCGVGRALKARSPDVQVVAVEPLGSTIFGGTFEPYLNVGAGLPAPSEILRRFGSVIDRYAKVPDALSIDSAVQFARDEGMEVGVTSGMVLTVARDIARRRPGDVVVAVAPDGAKYYSDLLRGGGSLLPNDAIELVDAQAWRLSNIEGATVAPSTAALARIDPGLLVRSDPSAARMPVSDPAGRCAKEAPVLDLSPLVPA